MTDTRLSTRYFLITSGAKMPSNCMGSYARVGILEMDLEHWDGITVPTRITDQPKAVKRIIRTWEDLNVGKTGRCAYGRAKIEAEAVLAELQEVEGS